MLRLVPAMELDQTAVVQPSGSTATCGPELDRPGSEIVVGVAFHGPPPGDVLVRMMERVPL